MRRHLASDLSQTLLLASSHHLHFTPHPVLPLHLHRSLPDKEQGLQRPRFILSSVNCQAIVDELADRSLSMVNLPNCNSIHGTAHSHCAHCCSSVFQHCHSSRNRLHYHQLCVLRDLLLPIPQRLPMVDCDHGLMGNALCTSCDHTEKH